MKVKILSSIPGRMRLKIERLLKDENCEYFLKESLQLHHEIVLASPNSITGNMLVYYDTGLVDANEVLDKISSISVRYIPKYVNENYLSQQIPIKKNYLVNAYVNDFMLSKRLVTLSVIMSGLALFLSFNIELILSILIWGFPGILFLIRRGTYKIAQKKLEYYKFNFNNPDLMYELSELEHLIIEDSILISGGQTCSPTEFNDLPYENTLQLIRNLRTLGLTDISMLSRRNCDINNYVSYLLNINKIELDSNTLYDKNTLKGFYNKDKTALIIKSNDLISFRKEQSIVFWGCKNLKQPIVDSFIITFRPNEAANNIPYVIETSKYCSKLIIRSENIAVAANTIGIFFAAMEFVKPLSSIVLYLLNYLLNIKYINTKLSQLEKGHLNGF